MRALMRNRIVALCLAIVLVASAGCGSGKKKTCIVRGKVTYDGKVVPNGTITFFPTEGPSASGEIQPDGSYTLTTYVAGDGAVEGAYTVVIVAMRDESGRLPEERNPLPPPIVPNKYTSAATSDLRAEVKAGENTLNFHLEKEKK